MTIGVGGYEAQDVLNQIQSRTQFPEPIALDEHQTRIDSLCSEMKRQGIDCVYLHAGSNLAYFTGTSWYPSERMVAAIVNSKGKITYIAPAFEEGTLKDFMGLNAEILCWHEHESPYQLVSSATQQHKSIAIDPQAPFFTVSGIQEAAPHLKLNNGQEIMQSVRACKSKNEIAIMQFAKDITLDVHKAVAKILKPGITTKQVEDFINEAHIRYGAKGGNSFCIVLFGPDTAFPHGVSNPKPLEEGDMVLIDTGCTINGYQSDITRTYVFGEATERQRQVWEHEKSAQLAAFNSAQIGMPCGDVDIAAREYLTSEGYGPDYQLPGLPHRTGHGIGLDIHEGPYLVANDRTALAEGMCFSNEPMLVIPNEFGVRLEDHFYMDDKGPVWFTLPSHSIDDPFGYEQ